MIGGAKDGVIKETLKDYFLNRMCICSVPLMTYSLRQSERLPNRRFPENKENNIS
jgi:hypothetical protein